MAKPVTCLIDLDARILAFRGASIDETPAGSPPTSCFSLRIKKLNL
jgi:hypothetical protein